MYNTVLLRHRYLFFYIQYGTVPVHHTVPVLYRYTVPVLPSVQRAPAARKHTLFCPAPRKNTQIMLGGSAAFRHHTVVQHTGIKQLYTVYRTVPVQYRYNSIIYCTGAVYMRALMFLV